MSGTIRVSRSHKATSYTITFAGTLNAASAGNRGLYKVDAGVTKLVKKHKTTVYSKSLKIKSILYNASGPSVTIVLSTPYEGAQKVSHLCPGLEGADGTITGAALVAVVP